MNVQVLLTVWHALFQLLIQVLPIALLALFGAELLVRLGVMQKLAPLGAPLMRFIAPALSLTVHALSDM